jgi:V/A-type H+-transporting ATPase subunit K
LSAAVARSRRSDSTTPEKSSRQSKEQEMETGLIAIGAGLAVGLAALATGYAQARIGAAAMGLIAEKPELAGRAILLVAIPETLVILGFAVAAMIIVLL